MVVEDSDGTAYFQWDGLDPVEERDASGGLTAKYVHGFTGIAGIGSLTYMKQGVNCLVPHKDNTGSIRELSDDSEDVVKYYEYDAFGTKLKESGNQVNRFQFSANYMQLKVLENIYLSPTRVYHAGIGRFLQKDRIRFGAPYTYVTNQPTKYVDPAGLQKEPTVGENVGITWDNGDGTKSSAWGRLVESANEYIIIQKSDGTYITVCREWIADGPHWMPSTTPPPEPPGIPGVPIPSIDPNILLPTGKAAREMIKASGYRAQVRRYLGPTILTWDPVASYTDELKRIMKRIERLVEELSHADEVEETVLGLERSIVPKSEYDVAKRNIQGPLAGTPAAKIIRREVEKLYGPDALSQLLDDFSKMDKLSRAGGDPDVVRKILNPELHEQE
ncbi:MAG: hypothetical protein DRZ76_04355, partial [Candidatus Nealsonbacteria bacterium]